VNVERLRATFLAGAEAEAEAAREEADLRAGDEVERAREESARLQEVARSEGEAAGELEASRELALARSEARRLVLEARQAVYEDFRHRALADALALRADRKAYARLLDRLESAARRALGDGLAVERDPEDVGGVRARAGRRSVDLTLPALVDDCIAALGARTEALWR
jgi:vacuolar-type H+-ATPase subunit E/Vma4